MMAAQPQQSPTPNQTNIIDAFNRFRQAFTGDPKAMIDQMIASGQVSQQQYNNAVQMANQMRGLFGMK
jgi:PBP1b-binding outer membrane lipoprotein LpoB